MNTPRAISTNRLVKSSHYGNILRQYNELYSADGRVNNKKFFEEIIVPLVPDYTMSAWYQFVKRFKVGAGLIAVNAATIVGEAPIDAAPQERALLSNQVATSTLIQRILNISADRAKQILENPSLLSAKEAVELGLKGMKAQDSRIHAVGKIREDNREQERFEKAFDGQAYD